jgi:beta-lactam-binding protein with PASTA domain
MPFARFRASLSRLFSDGSARKTAGRPIRARVWTLGRLLVLLVALGATFSVFFLGAFRVASRAREVSVPDLRGQSLPAAAATLTELGLSVRVDPLRRSDPDVPAEHVVWQEPEPGAVTRQQRSVRVRLSDGQQAPEVPEVVGRPERSVDASLVEAGIDITSRAEIRTQDYPAGSVVSIDPPTGEHASSVSLLVNRGEQSSSYVMPDLIGTSGRQAIEVLRARGFRATIVAELIYPGLPSGIVIRQTPQPGFRFTFGETISLEVSR